jgi:serine/threonine protein kinase
MLGHASLRRRAGTVFRVRERRSRRILVLKAISKRAVLEEDVKAQLQREIEVHARLVHPHIVRLYAYFTDADNGGAPEPQRRGKSIRSLCGA